MVLRSRLAYTPLFENKYVTNFFEAVPGLREWAVLGRSWYLANETLPDGSRRFDVVLLDAPATGHALDMLAVPKVIIDVAPSGTLRRDAELAWNMLHDPSESGIVVVTLPEELPLTETLELEQRLKESYRLPISGLVVNGCRVPLLSKREAELLGRMSDLLVPTSTLNLAQLAARRAMRERVQAHNLARLDKLTPPRVLLPMYGGSDTAGRRITALSRYFSGDSANLRSRFG
jgi:anion-transporting  ArsA/GET3 family ATPase